MTPAVVLAGALLAVAANLAGLWWLTPLAGLAAGAVAGRVRRALVLGAGVGLLGWGLPLALAAFRAPLAGPSRALGDIMGLPAAAPLVLTLLLGALLGMVAAWVAAAARALARDLRRGGRTAPPA
jgi:hypothetical protein